MGLINYFKIEMKKRIEYILEWNLDNLIYILFSLLIILYDDLRILYKQNGKNSKNPTHFQARHMTIYHIIDQRQVSRVLL